MNCRQYRQKLSDGVTDRLTYREKEEMVAHCAVCIACTSHRKEEVALLTAWQRLADVPAPDISHRLRARIHSATPAARPRRIAFVGYFAAASVLVCGVSYLSWMQKSEESTSNVATKSVASLPAEHLSLAEMLTEVRWHSSDARRASDEPPSYNEETRALLLPEKGQ